MDITINKIILIEALQIITPVTDKSASKPILSNFLLTAKENGQAEYAATDYEISIKGLLPVETARPGAICVSAKKMLEICREFADERVRIQSDEQGWVNVASGSARLRLPTMEIALYPRMEVGQLPQAFSIKGADLKTAIEQTQFAIQPNEARKTLMGVCLNVSTGHNAVWTSTDGHRLAQATKPIADEGLNAPLDVIVPKKMLTELAKVLPGGEERVKLRFDERSLMVETGDLVIITRLIEGKYPNVDPIIPKDNDKKVVLNRERMASALRIVSIMSADKIKPVKMNLAGGVLRLESEKNEAGEAKDQIEVSYSGEELEIGFNARYILDVIQVMGQGASIQLSMKGNLNPCLLTNPEDPHFLSVVMPLRIEW